MKVQNKAEILKLLSDNNNQLRSYGVMKVGLFGSFISDNQNEDSDVDLLVEFDPKRKIFKNFMNISKFTEELFGRNVEIVTPQSLSPYIAPSVHKEIEYVQTT